MKSKAKKILPLVLLGAVLCAGWLVYAIGISSELTVVTYSVEADVTESVRLVHLTDLHSCVFGENNDDLVELVTAQEPDLILMTGDMLDRSDENPEVACALIGRLAEVAPVYYGYGNHEYEWMNRNGRSLTPALTEAGATVLDVEYMDITVNGQELRIGGYHGYYRQPHMFPVTQEQKEAEFAFADDFEETERFKLLLCHIPTAWLDWGYIDTCPVDLVLSGHYHGGQIVLPLIGGLYAPYIGLFPEYTGGLFAGDQAACILSTGLGGSPGIPRVNNPSQIVVVDLIAES